MTVIKWDPKAEEFLDKLDRHLAVRIYNAVKNKTETGIKRCLEPVKGYDFLKIRVGDYRLFVDYYPDKDILKVRMIDHRGNAYKRLSERL
jgi:mRNA-degrading endonuclease RelE of RelBE toxin-antitoxin system